MGKNGLSEAEREQKARALRLRRLRGIYATVPSLFVWEEDVIVVRDLVDAQIAALNAETEATRAIKRSIKRNRKDNQ